jgi:E3 ubiquitin-protein ligase HERC2
VACQLIDPDDVNKKSPQSGEKSPENNNIFNSETFFESWIWNRDAPDKEEKTACIKQLLLEQREICLTAAENCLSAATLKQLLYIYERHFIALARMKPEIPEQIPKNQENTVIQTIEKSTKFLDSSLKDSDKATLGLARVGTRAALNFSFAFLRRAWRSGEDTEMCSELLQDSLDALQSLAEGSLFDMTNMSSLWIEAVEKSIKFLRQVVLGDGIPRTDRNISLNLLLELGIQKGTLSGSLEGILLLLTLWDKYSDNDDNRQSPQNANAPLFHILKRYQDINNYMICGMSDSHPCGPTESFLR